MDELYKLERPATFKAVVGNGEIKSQLMNWVKTKKVPHFILFQGGSGMGKTTLARIMAKKLGCGATDLQEINAAGQARGIETIKKLEGQIGMSPMQGKCRVYVIDEAHKLTADAQNAALKMLEDTPSHVYFFFCTTEPQKLLPTIRTRASVLAVNSLKDEELHELLGRVTAKYDLDVSEEVMEAIVETCEGSARKALVFLNQVIGLSDEKAIKAIHNVDAKREAIEICKLLINNRTKWKPVANLLKELKAQGEHEPEQIRWMMLGYATAICLAGGRSANRAFVILDQFQTNYFDTKWAGLVADCWEVVHGRKDE